jgi:hypothetical protein
MSFMNATDYALTMMSRPHFIIVSFMSGGVVATSDCIWVDLALCSFVELFGIIDVVLIQILTWWCVDADPTSVTEVPQTL